MKDGIEYQVTLSNSIVKRRSKKSTYDSPICRYQVLEHKEDSYERVKRAKKIIEIDGDSIREINEELKKRCKKRGLKYSEGIRDGNCLYRAVSAQLLRQFPDELHTPDSIRDKVEKYVSEHRDDYKARCPNHDNDSIVLHAIAQVCNVNLYIIKSSKNKPTIVKSELSGPRPALYLCCEKPHRLHCLCHILRLDPIILWQKAPNGMTGEELTEKLLELGIVVMPGSSFTKKANFDEDPARDYVRIALVSKIEDIKEASERILNV